MSNAADEIGFHGATPTAQQTVTLVGGTVAADMRTDIDAIHAAIQTLGLLS